MGCCFPCLSLGGKKMEEEEETEIPATAGDPRRRIVAARAFTFAELAAATWDFADDGLVGPGVYTGYLECVNQVVAIKQILLDRHGVEQGNREFLAQVLMLSMTRHPNIINLIGYCADANHRILVFEYMPLGSLEDRLYDRSADKARLDWNTRMKIAAGVARGLEHLHDNSSHPVIYRGMRCSDILLGEGYHPKLSEFGLAKLGPVGDDTHVSTAVMGAPGYLDPEYAMTGHLTVKPDVYSFGVVLLEIITGRRAVDDTRGEGEEHIVAWAAPLLKHKRNFGGMADPALEGEYPSRGLAQSLAVAAMCVQRRPSARPAIQDVVAALDYLASSQTYHPDQKHGSHASDRNQKLG